MPNKKIFFICGIMTLLQLAGCNRQADISILETENDVIDFLGNLTEVPTGIQSTNNSQDEQNYEDCNPQQSISGFDFPSLPEESDWENRQDQFSNTISISFEFEVVDMVEIIDSSKAVFIEILVFFSNLTQEDIILRIPPSVSNDFAPYGLEIMVFNQQGQGIYDLNTGVHDILPTREDFIVLPGNSVHCEKYSIQWLVSESGLIRDQSGQIVQVGNFIRPGIYSVSIRYLNTIVGYRDYNLDLSYDLDAWVGIVVSEQLEIDIP